MSMDKFKNMRQKKTIERLARTGVKNVKYDKDKSIISFTYDGKTLKYKVRMKKHLGWVGQWGRGRQNIVYYDDDVPHNYLIPLLVHEGVESYVSKKKKLDPMVDAHYVATRVEDKALKHMRINPQNYSWSIEKIYRIEMPKDKRKGGGKKVQQ
jgi:hypothetical protein